MPFHANLNNLCCPLQIQNRKRTKVDVMENLLDMSCYKLKGDWFQSKPQLQKCRKEWPGQGSCTSKANIGVVHSNYKRNPYANGWKLAREKASRIKYKLHLLFSRAIRENYKAWRYITSIMRKYGSQHYNLVAKKAYGKLLDWPRS